MIAAVFVCCGYGMIWLMDGLQNSTKSDNVTETVNSGVDSNQLTPQQQMWVDYKAINGLVINDDGVKKMTGQEFADSIGVHRDTLYKWSRSIPDFWVRVQQRRKELAGQNRLARMQETWDLKAMKGDWQFFNAWMLNFNPDYKVPTAKIEHEAGNSMVELMQQLRAERQPEDRRVIDAEVTRDDPQPV